MLRNMAEEKLLSEADFDQVGCVIANLLEEVIVLSEKVLTLEGTVDADAMQERIDAMITRVLAPLA